MSLRTSYPLCLVFCLMLILGLVTGVAAAPVAVSVSSDLDLSDPKLSLLKFASLFMSAPLSIADESLLTITVTNPNEVTTEGTLRLSLDYAGKGELGFIETAPITILPGTSTWSVRSGGGAGDLVVESAHSLGESLSNEWQITNWGGDEAWLQANVFDWTSMAGAIDVIEQIRALEIPSGSYSLNATLRYGDPDSPGVQTTRHSFNWSVVPSQPVSIVMPDSTKPAFPSSGVPADPLEFSWELPDLPDGIGATSTIVIRDGATGGHVSDVEIYHTDGYGETFTYVMRAHGLRTGRPYIWSLNFVNDLTGKTVGGVVPSATFWLENEPPEIIAFETDGVNVRAGDTVSFTVDYEDDGDERRDLEVAWYLDGALQVSGRDRFDVTFPHWSSTEEDSRDHVVEVEVTDRLGGTTTRAHTVSVQANRPPAFELEEPTETLFKLGSAATFAVTPAGVRDPDGDSLQRVEWFEGSASGAGDGLLVGAGERVEIRLNDEGERRITLVAEDSRGGLTRRSLEITVAANQAPTVTILDLDESMSLLPGTSIDLVATVDDDFDEQLPVHFEVNGDPLAEDAFTFADAGPYLIRAWATDSDGLQGEANVLLTVNASPNPAPTLQIVGCVACDTPPDVSSGSAGSESLTARVGHVVRFFAEVAGDAEDVSWQLNGRSLSATTQGVTIDTVDGVHRLTLSNLAAGRHTVVVSAENAGSVGAARSGVIVRENEPPLITLTDLAPRYIEGDEIQLGIDVADPEGDTIESIEWEVTGPNGERLAQGTQPSIQIDGMTSGRYALEIAATDSLGKARVERYTLTVSPNGTPHLEILEPGPGTVVERGKPLPLRVRSVDPDGDEISSFRIDGSVVSAQRIGTDTFVLTYEAEERGPLALEVEAVDARGGASRQRVSVMVVDTLGTESTLAGLEISIGAEGEELSEVPSEVPFGSTFSLNASVSFDGSEPPMITWLVDGTTVGTDMEPPYDLEHLFATEGEVTVAAIAVDQGGHTLRAEQAIQVAPNRAPEINILAPASGMEVEVDQAIELQAEVGDPDGHDVSVAWFLNQSVTPVAVGSGAELQLAETGELRLTARATDPFGAIGERTVTLLARASAGEQLLPRMVAPAESQLVNVGESVAFTAADVPVGATIIWELAHSGGTEIIGEITRASEETPGELSYLAEPSQPGPTLVSLYVRYDAETPRVLVGSVSIYVNAESQSGLVLGANEGSSLPKVMEELAKHGVKDVDVTVPGAGSLVTLLDAGLIEPDDQGNLHPNKRLNANEGLAIFAKVLGIASRTDSDDEAAAKARAAGLAPGSLGAGTPFTRLEVAKLLARALGISPMTRPFPFADGATMTAQERGIVTALYDLGIVKGFEDGTFRPSEPLSVAQIAVLIDRILGGY